MIWTLLILPLIVVGWYVFEGRWDRRLFEAEPGRVCVNVHPREAKAFLEAHPETQVLDVRSAAEFDGGGLPGAVNVAMGSPAFRGDVSKLDMSRPVLVYCAGGFRSRKAVEVLQELGFKSIHHLHRGYHSWQIVLPAAGRSRSPNRSERAIQRRQG